jgi:hypothetical protein
MKRARANHALVVLAAVVAAAATGLAGAAVTAGVAADGPVVVAVVVDGLRGVSRVGNIVRFVTI